MENNSTEDNAMEDSSMENHMMEADQELLATYLDGEMRGLESEALWRRLSVEPELAAELERQRAARAVRQAVWTAMEPNDATAQHLQRKIISASRRRSVFAIVSRSLALATAAAACILFGFTLGWFHQINSTPVDSNIHLISNTNARQINPAPGKFVVDVTDESGKVIAQQAFDSIEDARNFADDLNKSQARHREAHDQLIVPVSDQF